MKLRSWIATVFASTLTLFSSSGLALAHSSTLESPSHSVGQAIQPLADGDTPQTLYTIPTLPSPTENNNTRQVQALIRGLVALDIYSDEIRGIYDNALITIVAAINAPEIPGIRERAQRLETQFTNRTEVNKAFRTLNQFKVLGRDVDLKIRRPESVVDTFSASATDVSGAQVTIPTDFMYKVAQINLAQVPDNEGYVFSLKDENDPDSQSGEYQLILNNQNNELKDLVSSSDSDFTLQELADNNTIFIRDRFDGHVYDFASQETPEVKKLTDVVRLAKTADNSTLEIMIKPSSSNQVVHFGVESDTSDSAVQALTYGILDNSLSPNHMKMITNFNDTSYPYREDPLDPSAPLYDPGDTSDSFNIALNLSNWRQEIDVPTMGQKIEEAEHLRFFMAPGTKVERIAQV
ncbi:hypothetical protein [Mycoplasma sp. ATU-Cv-508]|uniref:hypothetical protein n=1 Tax=Mycoplasma sp. ATU-Cv-508 TaxID=2048001 RepID=UPI000FDEB271